MLTDTIFEYMADLIYDKEKRNKNIINSAVEHQQYFTSISFLKKHLFYSSKMSNIRMRRLYIK